MTQHGDEGDPSQRKLPPDLEEVRGLRREGEVLCCKRIKEGRLEIRMHNWRTVLITK